METNTSQDSYVCAVQRHPIVQMFYMGIFLFSYIIVIPPGWGVEDSDSIGQRGLARLGELLMTREVARASEDAIQADDRQVAAIPALPDTRVVQPLPVSAPVSRGVDAPDLLGDPTTRGLTILSSLPTISSPTTARPFGREAEVSDTTHVPGSVHVPALHHTEEGDGQTRSVLSSVVVDPLPQATAPKTVALFPVGPMDTGKSTLVNLAAILSVYLNAEALDRLDQWYDEQYPNNAFGLCNPFFNETEIPQVPLPPMLVQTLNRFVAEESLKEVLIQDHKRCAAILLSRVVSRVYRSAEAHLREFDVSYDRNSAEVLFLPASALCKYNSSRTIGKAENEEVAFLYAEDMQTSPVWDLIIGNRPGWILANLCHRRELVAARQVSLLEHVKARIQPNFDYATRSYRKVVTDALVKFKCGKHILFQLPASTIIGGYGECREVVEAIQYISKETRLPILLAVSHASDHTEEFLNVDRIAEFVYYIGARIPNENIFFFELGGLFDLTLDNFTVVDYFDQCLVSGQEGANGIRNYLNACCVKKRGAMLEEIIPQLPQLVNLVQYRWARNLAMTHKLLKRIHSLENDAHEDLQAERDTLFEERLPRDLYIKETYDTAAYVRINVATRQCTAIRSLDLYDIRELPLTHIHFIRLFKFKEPRYIDAARETAVYSYEATLQHMAGEGACDRHFDPERDLDARIRASYLWEPEDPPSVRHTGGMIVHTHGTLKTITHPGIWLFFDLGRKEYTETKISSIRNFEADEIVAHNTLQSAYECIEAEALPVSKEGQVAWLVLNTDLCTKEVVRQDVHEAQRARILEARIRYANRMVRHLTGVSCTEEQLRSGAFVIPLEGQKLEVRQQGSTHAYWAYPRAVDAEQFQGYLNLNNQLI